MSAKTIHPSQTENRHPAIHDTVRWFSSRHLQDGEIADASLLFEGLACEMLDVVKHDSSELTVAFRKLLEAKDAFVRAAIIQKEQR